ncbi:unnamed protein product [Dovyalis caffra]|uniref:Uncharacterized protein n=1 Tax=Dovyalis caffra TaxID=77055 RepID=A0AAV1RJ30_9ROSI|nr:unnamed protein product [Dovyalis caffra]
MTMGSMVVVRDWTMIGNHREDDGCKGGSDSDLTRQNGGSDRIFEREVRMANFLWSKKMGVPTSRRNLLYHIMFFNKFLLGYKPRGHELCASKKPSNNDFMLQERKMIFTSN